MAKKEKELRFMRPTMLYGMGFEDDTIINGLQLAECIVVNQSDYDTELIVNGLPYTVFYKKFARPPLNSKWHLSVTIDIKGYIVKITFTEVRFEKQNLDECPDKIITQQDIESLLKCGTLGPKSIIKGEQIINLAIWVELEGFKVKIYLDRLQWREVLVESGLTGKKVDPGSTWILKIVRDKEKKITALKFKTIKLKNGEK